MIPNLLKQVPLQAIHRAMRTLYKALCLERSRMGGKQSAEGKSWEIPGEYKPVGDNAGCSGGHKNLQEALFGCLWVRGKVEQ